MIKVLIADDQKLIRESLKIVLDTYQDIQVIDTVGDGKQVLESIEEQEPDVILMDIRMPNMDGTVSTKLVKQSYPHIKIIILTTFDDDDFIFSALKYGASGYILKGVSPTELHDAITTVYNGGSMINPNIAAKVVKLFSKMAQSEFEIDVDKEGAALITDAEWRVIYQVGRGLSNKEISQELFLSESTVRNHLSHILSKLNLRDRTQLAIWAVQNAPRKYVNIMKKRYIILSVLLMILVIISGIFIYQKKQNVITIGIYSDSSWDVPNDNEYKFIDYVVKKFEKETPNVKV